MRLIGGYLIREISLGILAVLLGFLGLFAFFDLINELEDIGTGGYKLQHAVLYVLLSLPGHVYELMPVAALIGCIYALAQFAGSSEFTAMRAAGMSRFMALRSIIGIGVVLAILTALAGEWVAPVAEQLAQKLRLNVLGASQGGTFRSGLWIKDSVKDEQGRPVRLRFVNIGQLTPDGRMERIEIHEFDPSFRLSSVIRAAAGTYDPQTLADGTVRSQWRLTGVERTRFDVATGESGIEALRARLAREEAMAWESDLNPGILAVLTIAPDRMSAWALWRYTRHLRENAQNASRYELALWKKIVYPVAIIVMLMLALPFGYLQSRAGGIGLKLFLGVMLGVGFYFMNGLFSNLGLLNTWPPWLAVSIPSMVAFALALLMLGRVGRSY
ncbi:MAG: LPS export ABC transporter permease LptG [Burkholderiaceae bacterium]|nr:LPS export ABC transporter permease LptG [Burkholderiaceae bacterium]